MESLAFSVPSPSGEERSDALGSAGAPHQPETCDGDVWRPVIGPGEVTVTDITLNALTVTFRESTVAKDFFREWGPEGVIVGGRA